VTTPPKPTKAAKFADDAEALGWTVERDRLPEGGRLVRASRGSEVYELAWHRNSAGNLVYTYGNYRYAGGEPREINNVKAALRDMAQVRAANGALLPFDPATAESIEILKVLAGKSIKWINSLTGLEESGELPRGGMHFTLTGDGEHRVLNFPDQIHTGFRSVRIAAITEVR
jgi:hypothetical protein